MSAIVPPLDAIPKLPAKGVLKLVDRVNELTDVLAKTVEDIVKQATTLPKNCKCNDPRVRSMKEKLQQAQQLITNVQQLIPKVQTVVNTVQGIVTTAKAIKAAITAAQLFNPITAPAFIASQLMLIQDAAIVNAVESLNQFATIPTNIASKLATIIPPLQDSISKLSSICNGDVNTLKIPKSAETAMNNNNNNNDSRNISDDDIDGTDNFNNLDLTSLNGDFPSKFYNKRNVSDSDILERSNIIADLLNNDPLLDSQTQSADLILKRQQELLTSILEAPSVVFKGEGTPNDTIGKAGDFYVDTTTNTVYGPKPTIDYWFEPDMAPRSRSFRVERTD